jgi:pimeloyl-ACP methyl ester carboxylesterase
MLAGCGGDVSADSPSSAPTTSAFAVPTSAPPSTAPATTPASGIGSLKKFQSQTLKWSSCGDFECTKLTVPLDYNDLDGRTITLSVARNQANDQDRRIGSLVLNPGGPGGSGVDYVTRGDSVVTADAAAIYDLVGFDPRGVDRSTPVACLTPREADRFYAADGSPDSNAEATAAMLLGREFANSCKRTDADLLPFLGTRDAARDLEVLRGALGDQKLNYLGKSYGTFLGAEYIRQFPSTVGRFILDGAIDPTLSWSGYARGQATGFQRAIEAFLADCVDRSDCPLGTSTVERAESELARFLVRLDGRPLPVDDRELTEALATLGVIATLYSTTTWPTLRSALRQGLRGDGSELLRLADYYSDRSENGRYEGNGLDSFYAVSCMDRDGSATVSQTKDLAATLTRDASKLFGAYIAWGNTPCMSWWAKPTLTGQPVTGAGTPPVVVVGTTRDPATPYEWSEALAGQLAKGRLVTYDGDGHTAYRRGSSCVDQAVDRWLVEGKDPGSPRCG